MERHNLEQPRRWRRELYSELRRREVHPRESPHVEVQERGEIFFFYRPKVNKDSVRDVGDIQRLFIVLRPESGEKVVEEKQSSESGKEARFKEAKAEETQDDSADEDRSASERSDKPAERKKRSGKSKDSNEPSGRGERDDKYETDGGAQGNDEAGRKGKHEKVKMPKDEAGRKGKHEKVKMPKDEAGHKGEHEKLKLPKEEAGDRGKHEKLKLPKEGDEAGSGKTSVEEKRTRGSDTADEKRRGDERIGGEGSEKVDVSKQTMLRLIVMGRKSLPDPSRRTRPYWGFVELVTTDAQDIRKALAPEEYETKTRGHRENPPCRPVGEGIYRLVRHKDGRRVHTHLIYKLELPGPDKRHKPQEALNIEPEGSYIIQIKNPEQGNPQTQGLPNKRKATYPAHLQGQLGSYRFVPADPPDFLNYEGCELILISASDDIEEELGLDLEVEHLGNEDKSDLLRLFGGAEIENKGSMAPLIEGEWA